MQNASTDTDAALVNKVLQLRKLLTKKDFLGARKLADSLVPHAIGSQDISHLSAIAYANTGEPERAMACFEQALLAAPENPLLHLNLAHAYTQRGDIERAQRAYKSASALDPNLPGAHTGLANLAVMEGKLSQAEELFRTALRADANDVPALLGLGHLLADRNELASATERAQRLMKLAPNDVRVLTLFGRVLLAAGSLDFSAKALDSALALEPQHHSALLLRAQVALRQGDLNRAERTLMLAGNRDQNSLVFRMARAELSLRLQQPARAVEDLDWMLARRPCFLHALQLRSALDIRAGRAAEAFDRLAKTCAAFPQDLLVNHLFLSLLMEAALPIEALKATRAWCARAPNLAAAFNHLAAIEETHGDLAAAQQAAEIALALDAKQSQAAIILARAKLRAGHPSEALTLLMQAGSQQLAPQIKIELERLRGRALDAKGDRLGALAAWQQATALSGRGAKLPLLPPVQPGPEISGQTARSSRNLTFALALPLTGLEPLLAAIPEAVSLFDRYSSEPRQDFLNSISEDRLQLPFSDSDLEHIASRYLKALNRRLPRLPANAHVFDVVPALDVQQFRVLRAALPEATWLFIERDPRDALLALMANGVAGLDTADTEELAKILHRQDQHLQAMRNEAGSSGISVPALGKIDFAGLTQTLGLTKLIDQDRFKRACTMAGELPHYFPAQRWQAFESLKPLFDVFNEA